MPVVTTYTNGNASIQLQSDGTRIINYENQLNLEWPLNIDIRVSNRCSNGLNPKTGRARCAFCHESATTDGDECNYVQLMDVLNPMPAGIELAIGCNRITSRLVEFLDHCNWKGWIVNLTINADHVNRDLANLTMLEARGWIHGLGISYRRGFESKMQSWPYFAHYPNTVIHVIEGIDDFDAIANLANLGVKKILVLGEKDFGFNLGKVTCGPSHITWLRRVHELFDLFEVVSFDNLAINRLDIRRFFNDQSWETFHQGEYSFYINAVEQYFAPSSRSANKTPFNTVSVQRYFQTLDK